MDGWMDGRTDDKLLNMFMELYMANSLPVTDHESAFDNESKTSLCNISTSLPVYMPTQGK
jgi:hypothetical protein